MTRVGIVSFFLVTFFIECKTHDTDTPLLSNSFPSKSIDEYCNKKFNALIDSMQNFTECIMQNSISYEACSSCGELYRVYERTKRELESDARQDRNNRTCSEALHDSKISLINFEENSPLGLWENGSCDRCYVAEAETQQRALHPDYLRFQRLFGDFRECTSKYRERRDGGGGGGDNEVCGNCSESYGKLIDFFRAAVNSKRFEQTQSFLMCLDVKQKINASAQEWSGVYGCSRFVKSDRFATYALSAFFLLLPIAFYVGVYLQSDGQKPDELLHYVGFVDDETVAPVGPGFEDPSTTQSPTFFSCSEDEGPFQGEWCDQRQFAW